MYSGSTEIWTRIAGFRVQSANHYTMEPYIISGIKFVKTFEFTTSKNAKADRHRHAILIEFPLQ